MICAWKELLAILPLWLRSDVNKTGKDTLQELRLRIKSPPELILRNESLWLEREVTAEDLAFCVNAASRYSPWAAQTTAAGYLTAPGGHRIGICGTIVRKDGTNKGFGRIDSLCIRAARDYPGIAKRASVLPGSILIIGAPGWGKTTLLRDLARQISEKETVCVVDERGEVFPEQMVRGKRMDVLTGCSKITGMDMVLRTMSPNCIAIDEITAQEDCIALINAANCGVRLLATAHAASVQEFRSRSVYESLIRQNVFDNLLVLHRDKYYTAERMTL